MDLTKRAHSNLTTLLSLKKENIILAKRGVLQNQNEYVQVNDVLELEYSLYFTFHQLILSLNDDSSDKKELYCKMNSSIDNIYDNTHLNQLMEDDEYFNYVIKDIDDKISYMNDRYLFYSPLYSISTYVSPILNWFHYVCKKYCVVSIVMAEALNDINGIWPEDSEGDDNDSENDSEDDKDEKDEKDEKTEKEDSEEDSEDDSEDDSEGDSEGDKGDDKEEDKEEDKEDDKEDDKEEKTEKEDKEDDSDKEDKEDGGDKDVKMLGVYDSYYEIEAESDTDENKH